MNDDERFVVSSGNVFEDLGFDDPVGELTKSRLAGEIHRVIQARNLTQKEAAEIMGIQQPRVSRIVRGRLGDTTIDALMAYLTRLGSRIELSIASPNPDSQGEDTISRITYGESSPLPLAAAPSGRNETMRFE